MAKRLHIHFDSDLIEQISSEFDLRTPNKEALRKLIFTLDGDYDPDIMQVVNLATGVGKTYLMAAFIEYLRRQGVRNVIIVTPGKIIQAKTIKNFDETTTRYIHGAEVPPDVVTPLSHTALTTRLNGGALIPSKREPILVFVFNIQQLIAPKEEDGVTSGDTDDSIRRKIRRFDETIGVLFNYLKESKDLVVIADESHLYSTSAVAFHAALKELGPAATIGLTASTLPEDHVIFEYKLYEAIQDQYVKTPVLAFRKGGYSQDKTSEEQQLRDALQLRRVKQAYYDMYSDQNGLAHLNAVLFVVCSDTDHATQIAELLRAPEYFGRSMAVLQVDSKHDDDITQRMLEDIDQPDSPVLAVVSVNKLKEGWDVKNIAVVVTLRAMASEVLTQQTMGRGLRLPFAKYTGVWQIDQLDIISHQSFQELLAAENVLQQFGLEDAVSETNKEKIQTAILNTANPEAQQSDSNKEAATMPSNQGITGAKTTSGTSPVPEDNLATMTSTHSDDLASTNTGESSTTVGIRMLDNSGEQHTVNTEPVFVKRNPRFANVKYSFPVTTVEQKQPPIDLSEINDNDLSAAAQRVTSTGDVLYRKEIVAALGKKLRVVDTESAEVDSIHVDTDDAQIALTKLVINLQLIPTTTEVIKYVSAYLVPRFMKSVSFDTWTVKSLDSARTQLQQLIKDYIDGVLRGTKEIPVIHPKMIEIHNEYMLPIGEFVYDPIESRDSFVRRRAYSGWFKSLYEIESFDSYTAEYLLASLMNTSPSIVWWHRLHSHNNAYIYYTAKDRYFPDFVALDKEGVYWIVEGKDERGRSDGTVQAKRKAAESLVRKLAVEAAFAGQYWGYMIAYEDDVAKAESWEDLKTLSQPVSNRL